MQALGSAITYARRYQLSAFVGVAPDDDDDGNAASGKVVAQKAQPAAKPAPQVETPKEEVQAALNHVESPTGLATEEQLKKIAALRTKGFNYATACARLEYGAKYPTKLTPDQADALIADAAKQGFKE